MFTFIYFFELQRSDTLKEKLDRILVGLTVDALACGMPYFLYRVLDLFHCVLVSASL